MLELEVHVCVVQLQEVFMYIFILTFQKYVYLIIFALSQKSCVLAHAGKKKSSEDYVLLHNVEKLLAFEISGMGLN